MDSYKVTRIFEDEHGESRFEDLEIPLYDNGQIGFLSEAQKTASITFRKVSPAYDYDFHNAPDKQYILLLDGAIEIETSAGEKRTFNTGDVLLVEDVSGKGHRTRNLKPEVRSSIFIKLG